MTEVDAFESRYDRRVVELSTVSPRSRRSLAAWAVAAVPNAQVTVRSLGTGVDRTTTSDAQGNYTVPSLQPGDYSMRVQAAGFANYQQASVTLQVAQSVTADVKLGLAATGEVVQVQGTAPILDAQTMTVGQVIDQKTVQEIPLNGRHFLDLTNLTPGTVVPPAAEWTAETPAMLRDSMLVAVQGWHPALRALVENLDPHLGEDRQRAGERHRVPGAENAPAPKPQPTLRPGSKIQQALSKKNADASRSR